MSIEKALKKLYNYNVGVCSQSKNRRACGDGGFMKNTFLRLLSLTVSIIMIFASLSTAVLAADLEALADEFLSAVDAFKDTTILVTRLEAVSLAEAKLNAYVAAGGSENDAAIAESYREYIADKTAAEAQKAASDAFADCMSEVIYYHDTMGLYPETRALLDEAAKYIDVMAPSDPYISAQYSDYIRIVNELEKPESICRSYVDYAERAASATTFAEIQRYLKDAATVKKSITLVGFIGEAEAEANIEKAEKLMREKKTAALPFISAVQKIKHDDIASFITAISALSGVDLTTEGVEMSMDKLESYVSAYNKKVKEANSAMSEACSLVDSVA